MPRLLVIQHNVFSWENRKFDLLNTYRQYDPDVILINSHGLSVDKRLTIPDYRRYQQNYNNEQNVGVAIAVKYHLNHRVEDDFLSETLAIKTDTQDGPLLIATSYLHTPDDPTYLILIFYASYADRPQPSWWET